MKTFSFAAVASTTSLLVAMSFTAQAAMEVFNFPVGLDIPDNDPSGLASVGLVGSGITSIQDVDVHLNFTGSTGFNGDVYVYLSHNSGLSVLLNRTGKTASDAFGYGDSGFDINLNDAAANGDVHLYSFIVDPAGGTLLGDWAPDGRNESPTTVTDTSPRSALLSAFNGLDANGSWTLFAADLSPVGTLQLASWSLTITGVPEPSTAIIGGLGGLLGVFLCQALRRSQKALH